MDMQEKHLLPVFGGEDPSLPWPDSAAAMASVMAEMKAAPVEAKPVQAELADAQQEAKQVADTDISLRDWLSDRAKGHEANEDRPMNHQMVVPNQGHSMNGLTNDSIDPRLLSLAMGFVPYQSWETPYDFDTALNRGTIFPSLDMPWMGEEAFSR